MSSDPVICKRRAVIGHIGYLACGKKSELYECLKSVTDTEHKSIAFFKKLCYCILNARISEYRCYELSTAVRLVTA